MLALILHFRSLKKTDVGSSLDPLMINGAGLASF